MVGRLGVMVSTSAAVHVPEPQPAPVLVTPAGMEIVAVLVTCDCAKLAAGKRTKARQSAANRPPGRVPECINPHKSL